MNKSTEKETTTAVQKQDRTAVRAAKAIVEKLEKEETIIELAIGGRAKLLPVSATLLEEVNNTIAIPEPPMQMNEDKGREQPNPTDPDYIKAVEAANRKRGVAAMDVMIMFGVDLLDGVPEDDKWLKKLLYMEKLGNIDLSNYDLDDDFDQEFLYKRYIAVPATVVDTITKLSGIGPEEVEEAEGSFQSTQEQ